MHADTCEYVYTHMHNSRCIYTHKHTHNIFKDAKDIAAGQEILYRYGGPLWFVKKNIPHADVD